MVPLALGRIDFAVLIMLGAGQQIYPHEVPILMSKRGGRIRSGGRHAQRNCRRCVLVKAIHGGGVHQFLCVGGGACLKTRVHGLVIKETHGYGARGLATGRQGRENCAELLLLRGGSVRAESQKDARPVMALNGWNGRTGPGIGNVKAPFGIVEVGRPVGGRSEDMLYFHSRTGQPAQQVPTTRMGPGLWSVKSPFWGRDNGSAY